jgi:hypothetical protein
LELQAHLLDSGYITYSLLEIQDQLPIHIMIRSMAQIHILLRANHIHGLDSLMLMEQMIHCSLTVLGLMFLVVK